jgi:hypothetical protein
MPDGVWVMSSIDDHRTFLNQPSVSDRPETSSN